MQWNSEATQRCATFAEMRANGGDSSRSRSCPRLSDSIKHAVAEGCLDEVSTRAVARRRLTLVQIDAIVK